MKLIKAICPLCSKTKCRKRNIYSAILNLPGKIESDVHCCSGCGAYFLWPYISHELISELYGKSYFTGVSGNVDGCPIPGSGMDYEREYASARIENFRATIKKLLNYVPGAHSILDIGAATGEFLSVARDYGLSVSGIELSSYASARAMEKYGFTFHQVRIEDYHGNEKYDLIHMNHVFEHFMSPHGVLERIDSLLSPGGMVYVEVPFQFSIFEVIQYFLTRRRKGFDVSSVHHPIFYRPRTLENLFLAHGFQCRKMRVFDWRRYPVADLAGCLKRLMWLVASLVDQGFMIEAFFYKKRRI